MCVLCFALLFSYHASRDGLITSLSTIMNNTDAYNNITHNISGDNYLLCSEEEQSGTILNPLRFFHKKYSVDGKNYEIFSKSYQLSSKKPYLDDLSDDILIENYVNSSSVSRVKKKDSESINPFSVVYPFKNSSHIPKLTRPDKKMKYSSHKYIPPSESGFHSIESKKKKPPVTQVICPKGFIGNLSRA